jgi:hypothetical protein
MHFQQDLLLISLLFLTANFLVVNKTTHTIDN